MRRKNFKPFTVLKRGCRIARKISRDTLRKSAARAEQFGYLVTLPLSFSGLVINFPHFHSCFEFAATGRVFCVKAIARRAFSHLKNGRVQQNGGVGPQRSAGRKWAFAEEK